MLSRAILVLSLLTTSALAAEPTWPGWRGPHGDGQSSETDLPLKWNVKVDRLADPAPRQAGNRRRSSGATACS